ncbi:MAG: hypothetical protein H0U37_04670 [Chloroflexi bacterium]|nr:hypothetical protein [Chloroflexota bacterium]
MPDPESISIVEVTDEAAFRLIPPCADPGFDHRSCDYWEDADRGSKAARLAWLTDGRTAAAGASADARPPVETGASGPVNPFLAEAVRRQPTANPFATSLPAAAAENPFLIDDDAPVGNPFAPRRANARGAADGGHPKLRLLRRGLAVVGSHAMVLLVGDSAVAYCQFGPLSAYPRAQRTRDLYPALPDAPLPAVITCIATTAEARHQGLARRLVGTVCDDLATRGFAAVETYPEIDARPDATSAATPAFWESVGFYRAVADARFPVMRRELA